MSKLKICWNCGSKLPLSRLFCEQCHKIQKDLPSNQFELMGVDIKFNLDPVALEYAYFEAQAQTHPDRFVSASAQEKLYASQNSVYLNKAYQTLKDPLKRAEHLLELNGFPTQAQTTQDPVLLIELMKLQERLEQNPEKTRSVIRERYDISLEEIAKAFSDKDFHNAKKTLDKLKYLHRLLEER